MSEDNTNLLMKGAPDKGPAKIIISLIATVVGVSSTAASGLLGASEPDKAAITLLAGLLVGILIFINFKAYILGRTAFKAYLPFELDIACVQEARKHLEKLHADCQDMIPSAWVRANIFRPTRDYQPFGCACMLKIDTQLEVSMSDPEIHNIRFLPGQGHTGKAFMNANISYGAPTVAITREQLANVSPDLAYIISCPLERNSCILGVLNIDFCIQNPDERRITDNSKIEQHKEALMLEVKKIQEKLINRMEKAAVPIAGQLAKGKLEPVWLLSEI